MCFNNKNIFYNVKKFVVFQQDFQNSSDKLQLRLGYVLMVIFIFKLNKYKLHNVQSVSFV